jgi:hypothetical protein
VLGRATTTASRPRVGGAFDDKPTGSGRRRNKAQYAAACSPCSTPTCCAPTSLYAPIVWAFLLDNQDGSMMTNTTSINGRGKGHHPRWPRQGGSSFTSAVHHIDATYESLMSWLDCTTDTDSGSRSIPLLPGASCRLALLPLLLFGHSHKHTI